MVEQDRKTKVLTIITIIVLVAMMIGVAYAYFQSQLGVGDASPIKVTTKTTDTLMFNVSEPEIGFNATLDNFGEGGNSLQDDVTATATLRANSAAESAVSYNYNVYFKIVNNEFVYTTSDSKPELILTITKDDQEITSVDGLTYTSVTTNIDGTSTTISGFDITETSEQYIKIADNEVISTLTEEIDNYKFTITFINLDTDQLENMGKTFNAQVLIQEEELTFTLANYIKDFYVEDGVNGLYLHDGSGTYTNAELEAGDNSYRYAGAEVNNYVCFGSDDVACPVDSLYRIIAVHGDNVKLMKAEYATTEMLGGSGVGDYGMQYSETTHGYSYYTKGKVALEDVAAYYWNNSSGTSSVNHWKESLLNKTNLNTNYVTYLNSIDTKWMGYIANTTWQVAGVSVYHVSGTDQETGLDNNAKIAYDWEVGTKATLTGKYTATDGSTEESQYSDGKIGLIYVSDYMYAASPEYWNLPGYTDTGTHANQNNTGGEDYDYRKARNDNWMYLGLAEWTISRSVTGMTQVFFMNSTGETLTWSVSTDTFAARPTFNLNTTINFAGGSGTSNDPIRISQ